MGDRIRQIDQDSLRVRVTGPKCHPMADNGPDPDDDSDDSE